jgi:hypothetical protein
VQTEGFNEDTRSRLDARIPLVFPVASAEIDGLAFK